MIFGMSPQRPGVTVRLPASFGPAFVRFLVPVCQHVSIPRN